VLFYIKIHFFILRNFFKKSKFKKSRIFFKLLKSPQVKGLVLRLVIITPKKPNSALRHVAKVSIYKNNLKTFTRIPGIGFLPTKYNRVLIEGGRANDLPTVRLTLIRNIYDFAGLYSKKKRRSIYGTPRPEGFTKHIRRRFRNIYI